MTVVALCLMMTWPSDDEPCVFTSEPGKTRVMSSTALRRSWSPPSQLYPYSTVNDGMLEVVPGEATGAVLS